MTVGDFVVKASFRVAAETFPLSKEMFFVEELFVLVFVGGWLCTGR